MAAGITKMKDGRTRLGYKAQHAIDLDTEIVVGATIHHADESDAEVLKDAIVETAGIVESAGTDSYQEVVADKGYHKAETLAWIADRALRSACWGPRATWESGCANECAKSSPWRCRWGSRP